MPKTKISEYSTTNADNTDIESINIAEGCAPSGINNAIREIMVHLKEFQTGASGDGFTFAGGTLMTGTNTLSGTNVLSGSTTAAFAAGTVSAPSIAAHGDTNTGIFFPAADTIAFAEGGAEAMRIDSSGNVGIGTSSPARKLHVDGVIRADSVIDSVYTGTTTGSQLGAFRMYGTGAGVTGEAQVRGLLDSGSIVSSHLTFSTSSSGTLTERMRIDSSGNVGIGTSSPTEKTTIKISDGAEGGLSIQGYDADGNSGQVGIQFLRAGPGGASPGQFQIKAVGTGSDTYLGFYSGATSGTISAASVTERARITSGGDFLVNGTQSTANNKIQINTNGGNGSVAYLGLIANGSNIANQVVGIRLVNSNNRIISTVDGNGVVRDEISIIAGNSNGVQLLSGGTSWSSLSDERKKIIGGPIVNALEAVSTWRTVFGRYKTEPEEKQRLFLIAQDIQATHPEAVSVVDKDTDTEQLMLAYTETIPVLTAAIKELKAELDSLKAQLNGA